MAPTDFNHPYEPYAIQQRFMTALYDCIELGKVGIFESPTGTGKSLSLICGSLTWLRDHKNDAIQALVDSVSNDDDEPQWMIDHARKAKRQRALEQQKELEDRLAKVREQEAKQKRRFLQGDSAAKRRKIVDTADESAGSLYEDQFLLDDYESDGEMNAGSKASNHGTSAETQAILKRLGILQSNQAADEDTELLDEVKIFYCSRTHSQLSQFSKELRRVKLPPIKDTQDENGQDGDDVAKVSMELRHVTLGSRKNLCINPKVQKLGSATAINERCLELQQSKTSLECKCTFLPNKENEALVNEFRDHALARIQDIEDLGELGKKIGICPYYASRPAVKPSEIVTLPYPLLLQKAAREALDLSLKDHVIIIDEAHNLMDAIASMYSASISLSKLELGRAQLMTYLQKFRTRLKGMNRVYVTQLVRVLDSLISFSKAKQVNSKQQDGPVMVSDLMAGRGVDQINLFKLSKYIQESKLARKVDGYVVFSEHVASKTIVQPRSKRPQSEASTPILMQIQGFLMALMNPANEGRFFYSRFDGGQDIILQYMLLDPTYHFRDIVEEARAVILAGGTMSPMDDYTNYLFSYLPQERIMTLSCDHVIPPTNLAAWAITQDSDGNEFDFTFQSRQSKSTIQSAGRTIIELISKIPDGIVVFFSSYAYLDACIQEWKQPHSTDASVSIWGSLSSIKEIFTEPRNGSQPIEQPKQKTGPAATEALLAAYSAAINGSAPNSSKNGALLLSVINGSLSEGINFSDQLGRAVIVFGLPFPNSHSAEWKAKMEYISSKETTPAAGKAAAQEFYENVAMRAVNQAVGRAIRHKDDYANIFLVDKRYATERIRKKLPGWIQRSLHSSRQMGEVLQRTGDFFEGKKS